MTNLPSAYKVLGRFIFVRVQRDSIFISWDLDIVNSRGFSVRNSLAKRIRFQVKLSVVPSTGERWALVEWSPAGIAHEASTLYCAASLRENGLSFNTQLSALRAVASALNWAADRGLDLDQRIGACDFLDRGEVHDLRAALRRSGDLDKARAEKAKEIVKPTVGNATWATRIRYVCDYVAWHGEHVISRIPARDAGRHKAAAAKLEAFKKAMLAKLPSGKSGGREAMDEEQRKAFLVAIEPGSPRNPFKPPYQFRNYVLLRLLFAIGCRRGEALKLTGADLHLLGDRKCVVIAQRQDRPDDPRRNEPRPKTQGRECVINDGLASLLMRYLKEDRRRTPNAKKTPFVFLARDGKPLSLQAVNDMFRLLRAAVPALPDSLSPHTLRHDWNERFSDAADERGLSDAEEKQARNYANGWNKDSEQSSGYLVRRTRKRAGELSLRLQNKSFGEEQ